MVQMKAYTIPEKNYPDLRTGTPLEKSYKKVDVFWIPHEKFDRLS